LVEVKLFHASVQGVNAAPEIVDGINYFSNHKNVDVVIIGRGGGSLEDLWPFNEEAVARAVFHCEIPIISAVGHEVDFSISDFVSSTKLCSSETLLICISVCLLKLFSILELR
jgi:exodeoxyribonuclease VII large subunit